MSPIAANKNTNPASGKVMAYAGGKKNARRKCSESRNGYQKDMLLGHYNYKLKDVYTRTMTHSV